MIISAWFVVEYIRGCVGNHYLIRPAPNMASALAVVMTFQGKLQTEEIYTVRGLNTLLTNSILRNL